MKKKILIGSIIAVVILVLVSFTGVVGYQTTQSSTIDRASPLFTVRSSRAIDEDSKDFTCDYVGKGEECNIQFPQRMIESYKIGRALELLSKMDDKTFQRFINGINNWNYQNREIESEYIPKMVAKLHNLRENDNIIINYDTFTKFTSKTPYLCAIQTWIRELLIWLIDIWVNYFTSDTPLLCGLIVLILDIFAIPFLIFWIIGALLGLWPMFTSGETACTMQCRLN